MFFFFRSKRNSDARYARILVLFVSLTIKLAKTASFLSLVKRATRTTTSWLHCERVSPATSTTACNLSLATCPTCVLFVASVLPYLRSICR